MKVEELRHGNYYVHGDSFVHHRGKVDQYHIGEIDVENYQPIPITEEWLIKFGFERYDNEANNYQLKDDLRYNIFNKTLKGYLSDGVFGRWVILNDQVDYVHQCQNIIFALTQTELTIK